MILIILVKVIVVKRLAAIWNLLSKPILYFGVIEVYEKVRTEKNNVWLKRQKVTSNGVSRLHRIQDTTQESFDCSQTCLGK